jgi:hypothetical protein
VVADDNIDFAVAGSVVPMALLDREATQEAIEDPTGAPERSMNKGIAFPASIGNILPFSGEP